MAYAESSSMEDVSLVEHSAIFHSEWSDPIGGLLAPDLQRHEAFVAYAKLIIQARNPYLLAFLAGSRARVLVGPEIFSFDLPSARGTWIEMKEIATHLTLIPWAEPDEVAH